MLLKYFKIVVLKVNIWNRVDQTKLEYNRIAQMERTYKDHQVPLPDQG